MTLLFAPGVAGAQVLNAGAVADATVSDNDGNGAFETVTGGGFNLVIRNFQDFAANLDFEDRAVLEFDISGVPTGAIITSAEFTFDEIVATSNAGRIVNILGYSGDGSVSTADATAAGAVLASYDNFAIGLGVHTLPLSTAFFQSLLGTSSFAGLRLQGELTTNTAIASTEAGAFFQAPRLTLRYRESAAVPEPGTYAFLGGLFAPAAMLLRRRA